MPTADVIPLFPDKPPVTSVEPAHLPCPDLICYSLNQEQKEQGLKNLKSVRYKLRERQLRPLRRRHRELKAEAKRALTNQIEADARKKIKQIEQEAKRIKERWPIPEGY